MKNNKYCISEEEVNDIIKTLINEKPNYDEHLILVAIKGCCSKSKIVKTNNSFIECVRERAKQIYLITYKN